MDSSTLERARELIRIAAAVQGDSEAAEQLSQMADGAHRIARTLPEVQAAWEMAADAEAEWQRTFGEPMPRTAADLRRWAQRLGWDGEFVRQGNFGFREVVPQVEGRLLALQDANKAGATGIAAEHQTKPISKKKAAKLLGKPDESSGVRWLNKCIEDGTIRCTQRSRTAYVFDRRDFPENAQRYL